MGGGHAADGPLGTQQVLLAHHLVEALGPQTVGQGSRRVRRQAGGLEEIGHESFLAGRRGQVASGHQTGGDPLALTLNRHVPGAALRGNGGIEVGDAVDRSAVDLADEVAGTQARVQGVALADAGD